MGRREGAVVVAGGVVVVAVVVVAVVVRGVECRCWGLTRSEAGSPFLSRRRPETVPKLHSGTAPKLRSSGCSNMLELFPLHCVKGL